MAMAATASMTRSRRAEVGRHHRTSTAVRTRQIGLANALAFASSRAVKRQLDSPDHRVDPVLPPPKKPRLAAETQAESPVRQLHRTRQQGDSHAQKHHRQHESHRRHQPNGPAVTAVEVATAPAPAPAPAPASANAPPKTHAKPTTAIAHPSQSRQTTLQQQRQQHERLPSVPESKRKKPANGRLQQELQSLRGHHNHHHHHVDTGSQGRKLRSQEATRFKSELAAYFPEYDEVIGNDPKETHFLNSDTPIVVKDFAPGHQQAQAPHPVADDPARPQPGGVADGVRTYSDRRYTDLVDSQRVDLGLLDTLSREDIPADDPLPDAIYEPAHKKAERNERSIRNSEKGRARHERDQIIRLLESLQGPDWLRTLGVSGITESRKKEFEPARDHFIKGCQGILKKFRTWVAEEKRLKLEKELAAAAAEAQLDEEHSSGASVQWDREGEGGGDGGAGGGDGGGGGGGVSKARRPVRRRRALNAEELSDDDASIEVQLHELVAEAAADETRGTRTRKAKRIPQRKGPSTSTKIAKATQAAATSSFSSFFAKQYQRDAALGKNRRRGRTAPMAWGHPVPDSEEKDFELPPEFQHEATLKLQARRKRGESKEKNEGLEGFV